MMARPDVAGMSIEDEMRREIGRLRERLAGLDAELTKIRERTAQILLQRTKTEHDLRVLEGYFNEDTEERERQTTLANLVKK